MRADEQCDMSYEREGRTTQVVHEVDLKTLWSGDVHHATKRGMKAMAKQRQSVRRRIDRRPIAGFDGSA